MKYSTVKVFAPASVSNLAVGFDSLGFAIDSLGDEVILRPGKSKGLKLTKITGNKSIPRHIEKNTASYGALLLLQELGLEELPIEMELFKHMAIGTGLGSSAASAVAGVFAMNEYLGKPKNKKELLKYAIQAESLASGSMHADNIAPSLLGGLVLVRDVDPVEVIQLPVPPGLFCCIIHPEIEILTSEARKILSPQVSLKNHIKQSAHFASFICSLYTTDFKLMSRSMKDFIIEPQRKPLIPFFDEMKAIAEKESCLGFSISGAGPSVFALCNNSLVAEKIGELISLFLKEKRINSNKIISKINQAGAFKY
jgi:homoserine kinase